MTENQSSQPKNEKERKRRPVFYWIIITILVLMCGFLFISKNKIADQTKTIQARLDSVTTDKNLLQSDFEAASVKIDQLITDNTKLDSNLERDRLEIIALQSKIKSLLSNRKATSSDLSKAKQLIATLNVKTSQYEARIAELEKENAILSNKNEVLVRERDSTVTQNIAIKRLASVLHASNMRMEAIRRTRSGKEKETIKARRAELLRIVFDIDENRVTESTNKQVFLRIVGPDGEVLSTQSNGSGNVLTAKGDQIKFSIMKEVPVVKGQPVKDIVVDWHQDGDYQRGNYLIEVYSDGYRVGSGQVRLK